MGGRGGYSGKYSGLDVSTLSRMLDRQETIMRNNSAARRLDPDSESDAVRRKGNAARKAYDAAFNEAKEIEAAMERAKKRKRAVPF